MLRNTARCIGTTIGFVALFLIVVYGLFVLLQAMFSGVDNCFARRSSRSAMSQSAMSIFSSRSMGVAQRSRRSETLILSLGN